MKWNKAVQMIIDAFAEGREVHITYHRKWMTNDSHTDKVENVTKYQWCGVPEYAVNTYHDQINAGSHIIDEVEIV